jgi:hypothetical protein
MAACGLFFGAIINANIFGELAVIMASIGHHEKEFQKKYASANTVMIQLNLPEETRQDIRDSLIRNQPSLENQREMREFLNSISPSINFKVLIDQYKKVLKRIPLFKQSPDVIQHLIYKITLQFNGPEMIFIR